VWIVRIALQRPHTFLVLAIAILLATPLALLRMPVDVLPEIDIPVISIIWSYSGLSAQEMGERITQTQERGLTTLVSDIEHTESQSLPGIAVIKVFLQPNANVQTAIAQAVAFSQTAIRFMPPGTTPPLVLKYTASSVPVVQIGVSSEEIPEAELFDLATTVLRPPLVTIPGVAMPWPYGGKQRVISVDIDPSALLARGLSSSDVVAAVSAQNLVLPAGTAKIGDTEFAVSTNASPGSIEALNALPVRTRGGATAYLREVAHVRDGFQPQTNLVRQNGQRGVLLTALKNGGASTLSVVEAIKERLPALAAMVPASVHMNLLLDQSVFVRSAVASVVEEAVAAAALTAAMLLLFLGNWRTTAIIAVSIPLSIFSSIVMLDFLGQTLNVMTLGGLALAVGILVDDATVTIENIERHLHMGTDLRTAIYEGAGEIAVPAFVSTLCICVVFLPMFFLEGVSRYLFAPMAEAVIFAMLASYLLSRTLVPTLALLLLGHARGEGWVARAIGRVHDAFQARFERVRAAYVLLLSHLLAHRPRFLAGFLAACLASVALVPLLGRDLFPHVDTGQIKLHMRAPTGTRIERTARIADEVEDVVREVIPAAEIQTLVDNIGLPYSGINLTYSSSGTIGTLDADILISLRRGHAPVADYVEALPARLRERFPGVEFFFQPADIITQILNFGIPSSIDVQLTGYDVEGNRKLAAALAGRIAAVHGTADVHVHQRLDAPSIALTMDRTRLQEIGLAPLDVAQNLLLPLSGSMQTSPTFFLNPKNRIVYGLTAQTPQHLIASMDDLLRLPVAQAGATPGAGQPPQLLGNLVQASAAHEAAVLSRYNAVPSIDVLADVRGRDLGSVAGEIDAVLRQAASELPKGSRIALRGQVQAMRASYLGLGLGVLAAIVLVYLLIVVNFQSWLDPLIIISALPAAIAGISWMLLVTGTGLSVPALTGAIMTVGVATANSILVVAFARQRLRDGVAPLAAALEAGATRLRPVLMTAAAMVIGMVPMALGIGEGSEQNAPLGRAVIGGLLFATVSTVLFVPVVFASFHQWLALRAGQAGGFPPADSEPHQP
jgi:multidrug efflux pump subunit AcrB